MRVAIPMSGSGTNAVKILEHQDALMDRDPGSPYEVVLLCTDNKNSNAFEIGRRFGIPVVLHDLQEFYGSLGKSRRDLSVRPKYFEMVVKDLQDYGVHMVAFAGYMVIATQPLLSEYRNRILNVHPADLSIRNGEGKAIFTGDKAVLNTILAGQSEMRSTVHIVTEAVDQGSPILISKPVPIILPEGVTLEQLRKPENRNLAEQIASANQDRLKKDGDWIVYPKVMEMLAEGEIEICQQGGVRYSETALELIAAQGLKRG